MNDLFTREQSLLITPKIEILFNGEERDPRVIKRLPINYQQDRVEIERLRLEVAYANQVVRGICLKFEENAPNIKGPTFETRLTSVLTVRQLRRRGRQLSMALPISVGYDLLTQMRPIFDKWEFSTDPNDPGAGFYPEYNPSALIIEDGSLLLSHVSSGLPPALNSTLFRHEDRAYLECVAPEQCITGRTPARNSHLFTLGHLMFELLTGNGLSDLWQNTATDILLGRKSRHIHPLVSDVRPDLEFCDQVVMDLLHPLPERRRFNQDHFLKLIEQLGNLPEVTSGPSVGEYVSQLNVLQQEHELAQQDAPNYKDFSHSFDIANLNNS